MNIEQIDIDIDKCYICIYIYIYICTHFRWALWGLWDSRDATMKVVTLPILAHAAEGKYSAPWLRFFSSGWLLSHLA